MNSDDELDRERVPYFAAQWAAMHDEELSTRQVTRGDQRVDGARIALAREIAHRDPAGFQAELARKQHDVQVQATVALARAREKRRIASLRRLAPWIGGGVAVLAGLASGLSTDDGHYRLAVVGTGLLMVFEVRRFISNVVHSMVSHGGGSN